MDLVFGTGRSGPAKAAAAAFPTVVQDILELRSRPKKRLRNGYFGSGSKRRLMTSSQGSTQRFPRKGDRAGTDDDGQHQAVLQRRAIAAGAVIVFLILVVLLAKGCESAAKKRGIKDFINQTNSIVTQSNQSSRDFFGLLRT